jgi:hypothetical protein
MAARAGAHEQVSVEDTCMALGVLACKQVQLCCCAVVTAVMGATWQRVLGRTRK